MVDLNTGLPELLAPATVTHLDLRPGASGQRAPQLLIPADQQEGDPSCHSLSDVRSQDAAVPEDAPHVTHAFRDFRAPVGAEERVHILRQHLYAVSAVIFRK